MNKFFIIGCFLLLLLSGCASIVAGQNQSMSIRTTDFFGKEIIDVRCELSNEDGKWLVTTPNSVVVDRSAGNLGVICKKEGYDTKTSTFESKVKNMAYGNILFGGIIGAAVDSSTGAAFDYPNLITIKMEEK